MWGSIKYNLTHLADFSGRDARQTFWYFVLFTYLVNMALSMIVTIPLIIQIIGRVVLAAQDNPEIADQMMASSMTEIMGPVMWVSVLGGVVVFLLLAAAFVRRLHDSNLSGWWGMIPAALYAFSLSQAPAMIGAMQNVLTADSAQNPVTQMQAMQQQMGIGFLGWLPILILIVLGVRKSTAGPNRYGEAPVRF